MNSRPDWDSYFMRMLDGIAARSLDPNAKIGCILVGSANNILSTGYNSLPRKINDHKSERFERPEKYFWMEHAERNAIYSAARVGTPLDTCKVYVKGMPCMDCARAIIQIGATEVLYDLAYQSNWNTAKYKEDFKRVEIMFNEAKVGLYPWCENYPVINKEEEMEYWGV